MCGAVHTLDGAAHHVRKRLFVDAPTDPGAVRALAELVGEEWRAAMGRGSPTGRGRPRGGFRVDVGAGSSR
ncbi:hypothetical protein [Streptomyces sp. NPDC058326]|uniref:hypothetical protein n=1 Tax=Streptomyces sp. NPDC058326 TaxID=3346447 RepID=UPI0036EDCF5E